MSDKIQALIDSKRKFNDTTLFTDQVNALVVELMTEYAASESKRTAEALLLSTNVHCMNGIGEIKQVNNYDILNTDLSLDDVIEQAFIERQEREGDA